MYCEKTFPNVPRQYATPATGNTTLWSTVKKKSEASGLANESPVGVKGKTVTVASVHGTLDLPNGGAFNLWAWQPSHPPPRKTRMSQKTGRRKRRSPTCWAVSLGRCRRSSKVVYTNCQKSFPK